VEAKKKQNLVVKTSDLDKETIAIETETIPECSKESVDGPDLFEVTYGLTKESPEQKAGDKIIKQID
jgi:hypothetical protein